MTFKRFVQHAGDVPVAEIAKRDIQGFMLHLRRIKVRGKPLSEKTRLEPGNREQAEWLVLSANQKHGLRRTNKDSRRCQNHHVFIKALAIMHLSKVSAEAEPDRKRLF